MCPCQRDQNLVLGPSRAARRELLIYITRSERLRHPLSPSQLTPRSTFSADFCPEEISLLINIPCLLRSWRVQRWQSPSAAEAACSHPTELKNTPQTFLRWKFASSVHRGCMRLEMGLRLKTPELPPGAQTSSSCKLHQDQQQKYSGLGTTARFCSETSDRRFSTPFLVIKGTAWR